MRCDELTGDNKTDRFSRTESSERGPFTRGFSAPKDKSGQIVFQSFANTIVEKGRHAMERDSDYTSQFREPKSRVVAETSPWNPLEVDSSDDEDVRGGIASPWEIRRSRKSGTSRSLSRDGSSRRKSFRCKHSFSHMKSRSLRQNKGDGQVVIKPMSHENTVEFYDDDYVSFSTSKSKVFGSIRRWLSINKDEEDEDDDFCTPPGTIDADRYVPENPFQRMEEQSFSEEVASKRGGYNGRSQNLSSAVQTGKFELELSLEEGDDNDSVFSGCSPFSPPDHQQQMGIGNGSNDPLTIVNSAAFCAVDIDEPIPGMEGWFQRVESATLSDTEQEQEEVDVVHSVERSAGSVLEKATALDAEEETEEESSSSEEEEEEESSSEEEHEKEEVTDAEEDDLIRIAEQSKIVSNSDNKVLLPVESHEDMHSALSSFEGQSHKNEHELVLNNAGGKTQAPTATALYSRSRFVRGLKFIGYEEFDEDLLEENVPTHSAVERADVPPRGRHAKQSLFTVDASNRGQIEDSPKKTPLKSLRSLRSLRTRTSSASTTETVSSIAETESLSDAPSSTRSVGSKISSSLREWKIRGGLRSKHKLATTANRTRYIYNLQGGEDNLNLTPLKMHMSTVSNFDDGSVKHSNSLATSDP